MRKYIDLKWMRDRIHGTCSLKVMSLENLFLLFDKAPSVGIDLAEDGTLSVKIDDATKVTRVLVEDGKSGDLYYADESEEYEWCHDCKEYDTEKHCCPRWNKVIRQTVAEIEADRSERWIPCSERLPEETADYLCWAINPYDESIQYHMICTYYAGAKKWCPIDETASGNVVAWMPLPKPWKGADDDR